MSETEYARLAAQLGDIAIAVGVINEKLTGYVEFKKEMGDLKSEVSLMKQNCKAIQEAKKNYKVNWGAVIGTIIGGSVVGTLVYLITSALKG